MNLNMHFTCKWTYIFMYECMQYVCICCIFVLFKDIIAYGSALCYGFFANLGNSLINLSLYNCC